ncbi:MAG: hypothetical protein AB8G22_06505, partial [Saprospiraceae bacterium]
IQHSTRPHRVEAAYFFSLKLKKKNTLDLAWLRANYIENRHAHPPTFYRDSLQLLTHYYPQQKDANLSALSRLCTVYLKHKNLNYVKLSLMIYPILLHRKLVTNLDTYLKLVQPLLKHRDLNIQLAVMDFYLYTSRYFDYSTLRKDFIKKAFKQHPKIVVKAIKLLNDLNTLTIKGRFNDQLKDLYLKKLTVENHDILASTLEGLYVFTDNEILARLRQLKTHNELPSYLQYKISNAFISMEKRRENQ